MEPISPIMASNAADWLASADKAHAAKDFATAVARYRETIDRDPSLFEAWYGLGCASQSAGDHALAIDALRQSLVLAPRASGARATLAEALYSIGYVAESNREYARLAADPSDPALRRLALANVACAAPNDPTMDNAAVLVARKAWFAEVGQSIAPMPPRGLIAGRKVRIGYLGAFFGSANWMKGYMGAIAAHDRSAFDVVLIADRAMPNAEAGYRDHADDQIWDVTGVPNEVLAGHIRRAEIDVLVDLNGYSFQGRLPLLLYRAAPVQVSWVGMYGTAGTDVSDGTIGDGTVAPSGEERDFAEPIHRFRSTYLTFDMFYPTPPVAPPPCLAKGYVTFGSFASAYKLTDTTIALWARILRAVPDARLSLRNRALDFETNKADLLRRFNATGVTADRIRLESGAPHQEFLRCYDQIDIALDAFPYNGGTTTAEAIWQGVPLLTYLGDRWAGRTSASILRAAGLGAFVADDADGLVRLAADLAADPAGLASRRATQRAAIRASAAFDPAAACREAEALYRALLRQKGVV